MLNLIRNCPVNRLKLLNLVIASRRDILAITQGVCNFNFKKYSYSTLPNARSGSSPWLELEQICKTSKVPEKFNFTTNVFDRYAALTPSNLALWVENDTTQEQWTYEQLKIGSTRTAIALRNILPPNSSLTNAVIFVLLPKVPEWFFIYLASIRLGTIFCPATVQLSSTDIAYRLQSSSAKLVVTNQANVDKVEEAQRLNGNETGVSPVKVVVPCNISRAETVSQSNPDWLNYNQLIGKVTDKQVAAFSNADTKSDSVAQIFFTSGTTGKPKMVAHSHSSYGIGHYVTSSLYGLCPGDVLWTLSDPGWAKSSYGNVFAPWIAGACSYIHQMERFEVQKVLEILCKRPINKFCAPPTFFRSLIQETNPALFKFHSLRECMSGGEAVNEQIFRAWKKLTKTGEGEEVQVREVYGQTETPIIAGYDVGESRREQSLGKPVPGFDVRIVDNNGNELPPETEGHIAIKVKPTPPVGLFRGYIKNITPDGQLEFVEQHSSSVGDYYLTGDLGTRDKDNYLYFVGRCDDVIISAGYRIGPFEVEDVLQAHPAVAENAVVSTPNALRGAVVKAFIVLSESYRNSDKELLIKELQSYCKEKTAPYKYPREIEFLDALPKTVSGKILRRELRQMELEKS